MNRRSVVGVIAFFFAASLLLAAAMFGPSLLLSRTKASYSQLQSQPQLQPTLPVNNIIALENTHQGTTDWQIPKGKEAFTQIRAYASATSVMPGQKLTFYVSTQNKGTSYSINIYRLGWYGGTGGRLMFSRANLIGQAQGY